MFDSAGRWLFDKSVEVGEIEDKYYNPGCYIQNRLKLIREHIHKQTVQYSASVCFISQSLGCLLTERKTPRVHT